MDRLRPRIQQGHGAGWPLGLSAPIGRTAWPAIGHHRRRPLSSCRMVTDMNSKQRHAGIRAFLVTVMGAALLVAGPRASATTPWPSPPTTICPVCQALVPRAPCRPDGSPPLSPRRPAPRPGPASALPCREHRRGAPQRRGRCRGVAGGGVMYDKSSRDALLRVWHRAALRAVLSGER